MQLLNVLNVFSGLSIIDQEIGWISDVACHSHQLHPRRQQQRCFNYSVILKMKSEKISFVLKTFAFFSSAFLVS